MYRYIKIYGLGKIIFVKEIESFIHRMLTYTYLWIVDLSMNFMIISTNDTKSKPNEFLQKMVCQL